MILIFYSKREVVKLRIFVDFDNTITNSSDVVVDILNKKYGFDKDPRKVRQYDFKDLFPTVQKSEINSIFDSEELFDKLKVYDGFDKLLESEHEIICASLGRTKNLESKKKFLLQNFGNRVSLLGLEATGKNDKSIVDMSGAVFIDDHIECLVSTNASVKILYRTFEYGEWNNVRPNDDVYVASTWKEIIDIIEFVQSNKEMFI